MRRTDIHLLAAAFLGLAAPAAAFAEPDITGMWAVDQPPGQTRQAPAKLTPKALAEQQEAQKIADKNNRLIGEAHTKCWPAGMPGLMQPPFGIEFLQTKGRITILSELSNLPRTIYLDQAKQPENILPGWNGHSIGHWQGDVLYVDTIGFNGRNNRVSEKMHITEKLYLEPDGHLVDEMTLDDPETYAEPYHVRYRYKKIESGEGAEVMEYVCEVDPANLLAFEKEQAEAGRPSDFDPSWSALSMAQPTLNASLGKARK
jgi:hypothetical protein